MTAKLFNGRQDLAYIKISSAYSKIAGISNFQLNYIEPELEIVSNMQTPQNTNDVGVKRSTNLFTASFDIQFNWADTVHSYLHAAGLSKSQTEEVWLIVRKADGTVDYKGKLSAYISLNGISGSDNAVQSAKLVLTCQANPDTATALPAGIATTLAADA